MRSKYLIIIIGLGVINLFLGWQVYAGSPDSPGSPESTSSYSLADLYNRLSTGTAGSQSTFTEPSSAPGMSTMYTLNEIMAVAPAVDDTDGATAANILSGKSYFGLTAGGWGPGTGTMPDNGAVTITPGPSAQTIAAGYHNGAGTVGGDADLVAENIKSGVNLFGINGSLANAAPPCFDNSNRYVDCGNGTVMDTVTGLLWLKNANCFGQKNYATANTEAAGLEDGECGLTDNSSPGDWRLPTEAEWQATIAQADVLGCTNPNLTNTVGTGCFSAGPQPFTGVQSFYWSSTAYAPQPVKAWVVALNNGVMAIDGKTISLDYVWPVRGGQ